MKKKMRAPVKKGVVKRDPATRKIAKLPVKKPSEGSKYRSFVFYGRTATGKTTLGCSYPGKTLLCDIKDEGTDSVSDLDDTVDLMEIKKWEDIETTYWWLKENIYYDNVVIDTVSNLQQLCLEKVLADKNKHKENASGWSAVTRPEWGTVASTMKLWVMRFRDLPVNIIFIAQDRIFNINEDDTSPEMMIDPEVGPRLMPSVAAYLNAAVSIIGNTYIRMRIITKEVKVKGRRKPKKIEKEVTEYCLRVGPNPVYITKMRKPKDIILPETIVNPNYDKILKIIKGE